MSHRPDYRDDLVSIRSMMERSSRFISLSGLSGVFAGVFALIGVAVAYLKLKSTGRDYASHFGNPEVRVIDSSLTSFLVIDALLVAVASILVCIFLTTRNATKKGVKTWDGTSRRLVVNVALPLLFGGLVCIALLYHGLTGFVAPATLVFYGLALINGGKYTFDDIRFLGMFQAALGVLAMFAPGFGLWIWALGFGVLHIIYGVAMYFKYERAA